MQPHDVEIYYADRGIFRDLFVIPGECTYLLFRRSQAGRWLLPRIIATLAKLGTSFSLILEGEQKGACLAKLTI